MVVQGQERMGCGFGVNDLLGPLSRGLYTTLANRRESMTKQDNCALVMQNCALVRLDCALVMPRLRLLRLLGSQRIGMLNA